MSDHAHLFVVTPAQAAKAARWRKRHDATRCKRPNRGARWVFVETGLGAHVSLECLCGASVDVTDYNAW